LEGVGFARRVLGAGCFPGRGGQVYLRVLIEGWRGVDVSRRLENAVQLL
jgi:hypothetical protein